MPANRRRHANALPIASFATWVVIGLFVCGAGLYYVWCKNHLHQTGARIETYERELRDLKIRNEEVRSKIAVLSSTDTLQRRYNAGDIRLVQIDPARIIVVTGRPTLPLQSELQKVSNQRANERSSE